LDTFIIEGGHPLSGEISITGAKNAVLGIIPAAILAADSCKIENVPEIRDVEKIIDILEALGATVSMHDNILRIDTSHVLNYDCSNFVEETSKMRASYYLLGAFLGRYGQAVVPLPGGCNIGDRPIDQHIKGFKALGASVTIEHGLVKIKADKLIGTHIYLDVVSVGATINIMLAASKAEGVTIIENAAKEPHIVDVANFINMMGGKVTGTGTDTIKITGVPQMHGCEYTAVPDQIATGTYMLAAAVTGGNVLVNHIIPKHMEALTAKMQEMGITVKEEDDGLRILVEKPLSPCAVKTLPYPGFPTDLQQPMGVLMTIANGRSSIEESIFENRFRYVDELRKMGADIQVNGRIAYFNGGQPLSGAKLTATDLRAGAAMVLAGLAAEGTSTVSDVQYIDRGYEHIVDKLTSLGAVIRRESQDNE